jgi:hemoglobin/transferrin/lactoferrin receptor protein
MMDRRNLISLTLIGTILVFGAFTLHGQMITGRVVGEGLPLPEAHLEVMGKNAGAVADTAGAFRILLPVEGVYRFRISYIGYEERIHRVKVAGDTVRLGSLALTPAIDWLNQAVVVTAHRDSRRQFETPEALSVLSGRQIRQDGARTTPEALMAVTGVWTQKTNHGGGSPFVRGLTGNQTLLLLDGIRLNNSTYRYGPNQYFNTIDVQNIDRIEVLRGGGSTLYGSDALGGAIQVLTRTPEFSMAGRQWKPAFFAKYTSHDMEKSGRAELGFSGKKTAFSGGFTYRDFGDLQAGGNLGKEGPSSYEELAGDFKGLFKLGSRSILTLAYNGVFQSEVGRFDQVAQRGYALYQFNPQNRQMGYARLQTGTRNPWLDRLILTASLQHSLEGRERQREGSALFQYEEDEVATIGLIAEVHSRFSERWKAVSGIEFYGDRVGSFAVDTDTETGAETLRRGLYPDDSRAGSLAVFTSHNFRFRKFSINTGARYNFFALDIKDPLFGDAKITPQAVVGNVSVRRALSTGHALTASVNTGFRAPNVNDLSTFGSFDSGVEVPVATLSPEKSLTAELGYKMDRKALAVGLALFRTQLFDLIDRVPSTYLGQDTHQGERVYAKANVDRALLWGLEADAVLKMSRHFSLFGNLTYIYGQNTSGDEPMRRIPPLNGGLALTYQSEKGWYGQAEWRAAATQTRLSSGDRDDHRIAEGGTPGWNVTNLKAGYRRRFLQFNAGLQNVFNEAYRTHGSGIDGVGRSVWVGVAFRMSG